MTDDECKTEFRFFRSDIYSLIDILNLPNEVITYNGLKVDITEAFCILLKRFAYPCRYVDLIHMFAKHEPQLCMISNATMQLIYNQWQHLLTSFNQPWLNPTCLQEYADAIHDKGGASLMEQ